MAIIPRIRSLSLVPRTTIEWFEWEFTDESEDEDFNCFSVTRMWKKRKLIRQMFNSITMPLKLSSDSYTYDSDSLLTLGTRADNTL
jgi:hypothetical protein